MKKPDFNLYPEPYCIAKYESSRKEVVCYETSKDGTKELTLADRHLRRDECRDCPQLTEAIDMMMGKK